MPIQLYVFERRDDVVAEALENVALDVCRNLRAREGIHSSRFYWHGSDSVVILTEGETVALDARADRNLARAAFVLAVLARTTMNWRLDEPRASEKLVHLTEVGEIAAMKR